MLKLIIVSLIVFLLILFIVQQLWISPEALSTEHFDTYYNHDLGAQEIFERTTCEPWTTRDARLVSKYNWSERDKAGLTVFDKYYELYNFEVGAAKNADHEYAYRDIGSLGEENVYDTRFVNTQLDPREDRISTFDWRDTCDRNPAKVYDWHSQEVDALAQKNY